MYPQYLHLKTLDPRNRKSMLIRNTIRNLLKERTNTSEIDSMKRLTLAGRSDTREATTRQAIPPPNRGCQTFYAKHQTSSS